LRVCCGVDWAYVDNFFALGVSDALIGEGQRAQDQQQNSGYCDWFHFRFRDQAALRPWKSLMITVITARTSRMWIRPPMVYEVTIPKSQSTSKITQIVQSILPPVSFPFP
jgi:hypothetical protein